jgi:LPXTG-site transpeptidase (sortase) family protein
LEIPKIGVSVMVLEGDGDDILGKAAGHVPTTAFPGGPGNVVIAGHRDTFFRTLRKIRKDDDITFTTTQGTYHYQVGSIEKVAPEDVQVLKPSGHPTLTLITCYPFNYIGPAPRRFVVQAVQTQSSPNGEPKQTLASIAPAPDVHSVVRRAPSHRDQKARLMASRSTSEFPPARHATALSKTSSELSGPESTQETADAGSSGQPRKVSLIATRPVSDSRPAGMGYALTASSPTTDDPQSTQETGDPQQDGPPVKSPTKSHKVFGKVRSWLGSIPRRLHQD